MKGIDTDVVKDVIMETNLTNFCEQNNLKRKMCVLAKAVCFFTGEFGCIEPDIVTEVDKDGVTTIRLSPSRLSIIKVPFQGKYKVEHLGQVYVVYIGVYIVEDKLVLGYLI